MIIDYFGFVSTLISLTLILGVAYYATRILSQMKNGMLEKSWAYMSKGSLVLMGGILISMIHYLYSAYELISLITTIVGPLLLSIGTPLVILAFRSHYRTWSPKYPKVEMKDIIEQ